MPLPLIAALASSLLAAPQTAAPAAPLTGPPPTTVETVVETMHGETIADDYRWLESLEAEDERVVEWTTAQNAHTRAVLDGVPGRETLEARLGELMQMGSVGAPSMRVDRYFYRERSGDENQGLLYLRHGPAGEPRVLLDPNHLDERGLYALDWYVPSHDGRTLAFGLSYAGDEMSVLHLMDVDTGRWIADEIPGKVDFAGWAPDNRSFLYGQLEDPADAYSRVFRWHVVGEHHRQDPVILRQESPSRIPNARLSRDGRWIITSIFEGWSKQDIGVVDAAAWRRTGAIESTPIAVGLDARFQATVISGDTLYMLTTLDAPNGMLYAVDLNDPARENWRTVIPEDQAAVLRSVSEARGMLIASYQVDATSRFRRFAMDGTPRGDVPLLGLGSASISTRYDRDEAFLSFQSYNVPPSIYRIDLTDDEHRALWARPDVPVDPDLITVRQEWATSKDGTKVPMFVVHRKDLVKDGRTPTLVYGYGGFNVTLTPRFSARDFPWLENGGIYVTVNLRGGGEYGESWHRGGMLESKQNVFDDLYAAAEHLIDAGYTTPEHMAVLGGSNGGLLTGVAAVQRPDLWAAAISAVPLLDMLRYQNLLMAKFWVPEYGDPENAEDFAWLRAYSPYHNIEDGQAYPAMLFTAGENDSRVHPMHARKMAAAMQARSGNDQSENPILLWVDRDSGHGQGKPLKLQIRDVTDRWAFIMWQTGMSIQ